MPRKSYYIFRDEEIEIGWGAGDNSKTRYFRLVMPPGSELTGASVYMRSEMHGWWCNGAYTRLKINGQEVCKVTWGINDTSPKECNEDVSIIISEGDNEIIVECHKDPTGCFAPRTWKVTVVLTVEYVGSEPPVVTPPVSDWKNKIMQYAPWIIGVLAVGAVVGTLTKGGGKGESRKEG